MLFNWDENRRLSATLFALLLGAVCFVLAKNGILPVLKYFPELGSWSFSSVEGEIEQKYYSFLVVSVLGFLGGALLGATNWATAMVTRNHRADFIGPAVFVFFLCVFFLISLCEFI
jgi:hypothetical protein